MKTPKYICKTRQFKKRSTSNNFNEGVVVMKIQKTLCYCDRCGRRYELTDLVDPESKEYVSVPSCDFSLEIQRTRISNNERFRHQFELCSKCANSLLKWLGAEALSEEFKEQMGFDKERNEI